MNPCDYNKTVICQYGGSTGKLMSVQPTQEQFRAFQKLVNGSLLLPDQRDQAWRIFKTQGADAGNVYVESMQPNVTVNNHAGLRDVELPFGVWGREYIESQAFDQMRGAMRLPISVAGALMPDAHLGYGLPIGGVLATENAVIPYAVGVDIACRMMMTIYEMSPHVLDQSNSTLRGLHAALLNETIFGAGGGGMHDGIIEHEVLDESKWNATHLLKGLRKTAIHQIGTSGTGNHFVEWGSLELDADNPFDLKAGRYLALLSHSGSRGVGYQIADYYSKMAMSLMPTLDNSVKHLAWLDLDSQLGQEYWHAMTLAGEFASANHHVIHRRVADSVGLTPEASIENHHNFAWKETHMIDGENREVIVHRKGATPAGQNVLGIIPGTMADFGYLVRGKGDKGSLESASHGGGRAMSRTKAKQTITPQDHSAYLKSRGVTLIGGGLDESPRAYKKIDKVIGAQNDLVDIIGKFQPKLVRMASDRDSNRRAPVPKGVVDKEGD